MLTKLEPEFDIRFVERSKGRTEIQPIERFSCVVGHSGNIAPLILNGAISGKHCTIRGYDFESRSYLIEDGADGKPSSNGIYYGEGGETQKVDRASLSAIGQRVYLLRLTNGDEGYIELYGAKKEAYCGRQTQDLDPRLVRTEATAVKAHEIATQNTEKIDSLLSKFNGLIWVLDALGTNPARKIAGLFVLFLALCIGLPTLFFWEYKGALIEDYLNRRNPSIEQKK